MDFRDKETKSKIIRFLGHLARGDVNNTDIDEWGASGEQMAKRLTKCLVCEHYGIAPEDGVGPECGVQNQPLHEQLVTAWGRCPLDKWGEDEDIITRFFYDEALKIMEEGYPELNDDDDEEEGTEE